jgi:hypothetical protein
MIKNYFTFCPKATNMVVSESLVTAGVVVGGAV